MIYLPPGEDIDQITGLSIRHETSESDNSLENHCNLELEIIIPQLSLQNSNMAFRKTFDEKYWLDKISEISEKFDYTTNVWTYIRTTVINEIIVFAQTDQTFGWLINNSCTQNAWLVDIDDWFLITQLYNVIIELKIFSASFIHSFKGRCTRTVQLSFNFSNIKVNDEVSVQSNLFIYLTSFGGKKIAEIIKPAVKKENKKYNLHITKLNITGNQLLEVPGIVSNLKDLEELHVGFNILTELPESILNLKKLKIFGAQRNLLGSFPGDLLKIPSLLEVNLSANRLRKIELEGELANKPLFLDLSNNNLDELDFSKFPGNVKVYFEGNNLKEIPTEITKQGLKRVRKYYKALRKGVVEKPRNGRIVVIGDSSVGKTCFSYAIAHGKTLVEDQRPILAESLFYDIIFDDLKVPITLFDMTGQDFYDSTRRIFYSENTIFVLVISLKDYSCHKMKSVVEKWLNHLVWHAPGAHFIVVCSFVDDVNLKQPQSSGISGLLYEINSTIQSYIKEIKNEANSLKLLEIVATSLITFDKRIFKKINLRIWQNFSECGNLTIKMPRSWVLFEELMCKENQHLYLNSKQIKRMCQNSSLDCPDDVLNYLHAKGTIIYMQLGENDLCVFHRYVELLNIIKCFFRHKLYKKILRVKFPESVWLIKLHQRIPSVSKDLNLYEELKDRGFKEIDCKLNLLSKGILCRSILSVILSTYFDDKCDPSIVLELLIKYEFCYQLKTDKNNPGKLNFHYFDEEVYLFPSFQISDIQDKTIFEEFRFPSEVKSDVQEWGMSFQNAPGSHVFKSRSIVSIHRHSSGYYRMWRDGVIGSFGNVLVLILFQSTNPGLQNINIKAKVKCKKRRKEIGGVLRCIYFEIMDKVEQFPMSNHMKVYINCPTCNNLLVELKRIHELNISCRYCKYSTDFKEDLNELILHGDGSGVLMHKVACLVKQHSYLIENLTELTNELELNHLRCDIEAEVKERNNGVLIPSELIYQLLMEWQKKPKCKDDLQCIINIFQKMGKKRVASELREVFGGE